MSKPTREEIVKLGKQVLDNEKQRKLGVKRSSQELMRCISLETSFEKMCSEYFGIADYEEFMAMANERQKAEFKSISDEIRGGAGE